MNRSTHIRIRLSEEEKSALQALAKRSGYNTSQLLRLMIQRMLPEDLSTRGVGSNADDEKKNTGMYITWTESEGRALAERATQERQTRQAFIRRVVRAVLRRQPQPNEEEIRALRVSNGELAAIGRNLNQVARALNASILHSDHMTAEKVEGLSAVIREHRDRITALLNANWRRIGPEG